MHRPTSPRVRVISFGLALGVFTASCERSNDGVTSPESGPQFSAVTAAPHPMNANPPPVDLSTGSAVISNGTVSLGVRDLGDLNFAGVGVQYVPTGGEAIWVGCLCEGWGAADATSGTQGWASVAFGTFNVGLVSFASTATTATSVATVGGVLRVTHQFTPSSQSPFLYEIQVTIDNISAAPVDLRYTRDMDWDVSPTFFNEFVTIQGTAAEPTVLYADNNGFQPPGPLLGRSSLGWTGDFTDAGPFDHGALFDLGLGILAPGASRTFSIYYGAAGTETAALGAIAAVGATVYSLGQPNVAGGPDLGQPNTFMFAYRSRLRVTIDIKPGSDPNSISLKSTGVVPVAILGSATFDVTTVDVTSLTFGPAGATPTHDLTNPVTYAGHLADVNLDGFTDLVSHYSVKATGLTGSSTQACINGAALGGTPIQGCDAVRMVK